MKKKGKDLEKKDWYLLQSSEITKFTPKKLKNVFYMPTQGLSALGFCAKCIYKRSLVLLGHQLRHTQRGDISGRKALHSTR